MTIFTLTSLISKEDASRSPLVVLHPDGLIDIVEEVQSDYFTLENKK